VVLSVLLSLLGIRMVLKSLMTSGADFVEEMELIMCFGDSYREYMKSVPAFFPKTGQVKDLSEFPAVSLFN